MYYILSEMHETLINYLSYNISAIFILIVNGTFLIIFLSTCWRRIRQQLIYYFFVSMQYCNKNIQKQLLVQPIVLHNLHYRAKPTVTTRLPPVFELFPSGPNRVKGFRLSINNITFDDQGQDTSNDCEHEIVFS